MRTPLAGVLLAALAASALAQEEDPLVRAVREQEALRERQAQGIRRAEHRAFSPLTADPTVNPGLQSMGEPGASARSPVGPRPAPPPRAGFLPWAIAAVGVLMFALLGWAVLRRNRE